MKDESKRELVGMPKQQGLFGQEILYIKNMECIWCLQHADSKLMGKSSLDAGQTWTEFKVLVEDYNGYFSFTTSEGNKLHLSCKNSRGHLIYCFWEESEFFTEELGEPWIDQERVTYQTLLVDSQGSVHLLYFTENPLVELWSIKHCCRQKEKWGEACIVDKGVGPALNQGSAAVEGDQNIHLVYQIYTNSKYQLVYRCYFCMQSRWSEREIVTDSLKSNLYPCLVIDDVGNLHLTWIRSDGMNYRVVYRCKAKGGWLVGGWSKDYFLSEEGYNAYTPMIGILNHIITIIWQQVDGIYKSCSFNEGKSFEAPERDEASRGFTFNSLISVDSYKKNGVSTMETFDTGTTTIALLASVFQNGMEKEKQNIKIELPEVKETQILLLPNMEQMGMKPKQKKLQEDLNSIQGNFQRMFFESEDIRLTNLQMRETIHEKEDRIKKMESDLYEKENEINRRKGIEQTLDQAVYSLKKAMLKSNSENRTKQELLEKKLKGIEEENASLQFKLKKIENENHELKEKIKLMEAVNEDMVRMLQVFEEEKSIMEEQKAKEEQKAIKEQGTKRDKTVSTSLWNRLRSR